MTTGRGGEGRGGEGRGEEERGGMEKEEAKRGNGRGGLDARQVCLESKHIKH